MAKYKTIPAASVEVDATRWFLLGDHPKVVMLDGFGAGKQACQPPDINCKYCRKPHIIRHLDDTSSQGINIAHLTGPTYFHMYPYLVYEYTHGWLLSPTGGHIVCPGDWIIDQRNGLTIVCPAFDFPSMYEHAEENDNGS